MKKILILSFHFFLITVAQEDANLQLNLQVPALKLKQLKRMKQFDISQLQHIISDNIHKWLSQGTQLGITCQAVTPIGKWIGNFQNPDFAGKSIPGGQMKSCNLWLIEREKKHEKEQIPGQLPNDKPYTYQPPATPRYFAV